MVRRSKTTGRGRVDHALHSVPEVKIKKASREKGLIRFRLATVTDFGGKRLRFKAGQIVTDRALAVHISEACDRACFEDLEKRKEAKR